MSHESLHVSTVLYKASLLYEGIYSVHALALIRTLVSHLGTF